MNNTPCHIICLRRQSKKKSNIFVWRLYIFVCIGDIFLQQEAFFRDDPYIPSELKKTIFRQNFLNKRYKLLLPPFQIISHFCFCRYIVFAIYLDIMFISKHIANKNYKFRKAKMSYNLERGSIFLAGVFFLILAHGVTLN
jgi:hypothetical protein